MDENILVMDIETGTFGKPDPTKDILKYVGFRLPSGKKLIFHREQKEEIQNVLSSYSYVSGHNIEKYDIPIMQRFGFSFTTTNGLRHVVIDTYRIIEKRAKSMMQLDLGINQRSLDYLTKYFNLANKKGHFDYALLNKPSLTLDEYKQLVEYLNGDLDASYSLLEYLYKFFIGFKDMMSNENKRTMKWLTSSSGSTAYKIICHQAGLQELYADNVTHEKAYTGGFVTKPKYKTYGGNLYCLDFASLYPHMMMGGNLYSPQENGWHGGGIFKSIEEDKEDGIRGYYSKTHGAIEQVIQTFYLWRASIKKSMKLLDPTSDEYKMFDATQYAIKIFINTIYGIAGNPIFVSTYNLNTASDCTAMARSCIKNARNTLEMEGYVCLYTDTDSVYIVDAFNNKERLKQIAKKISDEQRSWFNIPIETHDFVIEAKIKRIWFFKGDDGELVKKHYIYLRDDNKIVKKGLRIVQGNCSPIARLVFERYIKEDIKNEKEDLVYDTTTLKKYLVDIAKENPSLLEKRYRVFDKSAYKNHTSIQAQISLRYGDGEHYLITNHVIGVGKVKKYGTFEELNRVLKGDWIRAVDFSSYIKDLKEFVSVGGRRHL